MSRHHIHIPHDFFALLTNRLIFRLALGLVGVFLPIFFYKLFDGSLYMLLAIYAAMYALGAFIAPLSARLLGTVGIRGSLKLAVPPIVMAIGALAYAQQYPLQMTALFIVSLATYRALYWMPYQVDLAKTIQHKKLGTYTALYKNTMQVMNALTPLVGGLLISIFGFDHIFVLAAAVLLVSLVPTHFLRQRHERYSWGYLETFRHLFSHNNNALRQAYMADGAQSVISAVVWPVFIFEILDGNYASVGMVTSLTIIIILVLNIFIGKIIDRVGEKKVVKYSTVFSMTGWLMKFFVDSPMQILTTDTYHRLGRAVNRMGFDAESMEQAADNGHYIDEFTTLKEMALSIGRVLMLATVGLLVYYTGNIRVVFILAALATLLMASLNHQHRIR